MSMLTHQISQTADFIHSSLLCYKFALTISFIQRQIGTEKRNIFENHQDNLQISAGYPSINTS